MVIFSLNNVIYIVFTFTNFQIVPIIPYIVKFITKIVLKLNKKKQDDFKYVINISFLRINYFNIFAGIF